MTHPANKELDRNQLLQEALKNETIKNISSNNLQKLIHKSEIVDVEQGQTILSKEHISTHAFIILRGSVRLLGHEPVRNELFTVGRVNPGEIIGLVSALRQEACEAAISRQNTQLLAIPIAEIFRIANEEAELWGILNKLKSPCEIAHLVGLELSNMNPTPEDESWILAKINGAQKKQLQTRI